MNPLDRIKHRQQREAARVAAVAPAAPVPAAVRKLEPYQAAVDAALAAMAPVKDLEARKPYKRKALAEILPFVQAYIDARECYPNPVAVRCMIWLFDVGDIERALSLGLALIVQGCHRMPKRFDSDMPTFVCDQVKDWARAQLQADNSASPYLEQLIEAMQAGRWDLNPAVASQVYVLAAKHADRVGDTARVVKMCEAAQRVNPVKAGVKTLLAAARAKLAVHPEKEAA